MQKTIERVVIAHNHYGQAVEFELHEYDSGKAGPHVFVQASVHGAELQGNLVIEELIKALEQHDWCGKVSVVPFANPWSAHAHFGAGTYGRFDAMSGRNWNRQYHDLSDKDLCREFLTTHSPDQADFVAQYRTLLADQLESLNSQRKSYGFQRGHRLTYELQKRSLHADIVLDLHTASVADLYLYAPNYLKQRAKDLYFPVNLIIPDSFDGAGDEAHFAPWTTLKSVCDEQGIEFDIPVEAYTIELGGEEVVDRNLARCQLDHIAHYLFKRGVFTNNPSQRELSLGWYQSLAHYKSYYADRACLCDYQVAPGAHVKAGDTLAELAIHNSSGEFTIEPLKALAAGIVVNHASTSNLQAGSEIFQILEKPEKYTN
jgi:predicted deacylase